MKKMIKTSRRNFIKSASTAAAAFTIVPRHVLGGSGFTAPSEKLVIAGIGAGGRGFRLLRGLEQTGKAEVPYLCEVDDRRIAGSINLYKKLAPGPVPRYYETAKFYKDFREMLANEQRSIDAVYVAIPDHNHAFAALMAMQLGKHVYVEKPLTHDIWEARVLTDAAKRYKVVTQMGNQGSSGEGPRQVRKWLETGMIGDVQTVYSWTDRPVWPVAVPWPSEKATVPDGVDWDLWQGTAQYKDYVGIMPNGWHAWWDYGTGAAGDMGCHLMEVAFSTLGLGHVQEVQASVAKIHGVTAFPESGPAAAHVTMRFAKTARTKGPVTVHWMEGGIRPAIPDELGAGQPFGMRENSNGTMIVGSKKKVLLDAYGDNPRLLPTSQEVVPSPYPFDVKVHLEEWVDACLAGYGKKKVSSPFEVAGPLTEAVLLANLAIRGANLRDAQDTLGRNVKMKWDHKAMRVTNFDPANQFVKRDYRPGWEINYAL